MLLKYNTMELKDEDIVLKIREQLNKDKIQLWMPPYNDLDNGGDTALQALANSYSENLGSGMSVDRVEAALKLLQTRSLERLREREEFRDTGVATLKVRVSGQPHHPSQVVSVRARLTEPTSSLKATVAQLIGLHDNRLKFISCGKVLKSSQDLTSQGVTNAMQILAVVLHEDLQEVERVDKNQKTLASTKADVKVLARRSSSESNHYLEVENQSGAKLDLPPEERRALLMAMTLHEKGRAALKREDYPLALVMLLDADRKFSKCQSQLLQSVDNYALLNLDIAWCYLCLKSVTQLPDAERRLAECEANFHRSYGPNLERLLLLKGSSGNEAALFMRLHLLQGIVLFHQNKRQEARALLQRARAELLRLKVDDAAVAQLVELGMSAVEARLGLRATAGNIEAAAELVVKRREERKEAARKRKRDLLRDRERRRLGRCADGVQWVEPDLVAHITSMGFERTAAVAALAQANNRVSDAIQLIEDNPRLGEDAPPLVIDADLISQVASIGFDPRMAKAALKKHNGDVEKAVGELIASGGIIEGAELELEDEETPEMAEALRKEAEAYERLSDGLNVSHLHEDHLDLTLEQEEVFLQEYAALLDI